MKIKVVDSPPVDPREFDLPESFEEGNIEDVVEIFNTPLVGHYNWDYTDADNRLKKLYELGKKLNWNATLDLDWIIQGDSNTFDFDINYRTNDLTTPELLYPQDNLEEVSLSTTLTWSDDKNASTYQIQISNDI